MKRTTSAEKAYPLFRPSARNLALALGVASGTVLSAGAAYLMGAIVDGLASGGLTHGEIVVRLAAFLGASLAAGVANFALNGWLPLRANLRAEVDASDEAIDQLLAMPQRAFERHDAGHFLNVVNAAAFGYGSMSVYLNVNVVGCVIAVAVLLGCAAAIDALLVPVFLCGLIVYFVVNWGPMHSAGRLLMKMMPARESWQEEVRRLVEEKRVANACGVEGFYLRRIEERASVYRAFLRRHRLADTVETTLPAAISPVLQVAALAACVALWAAGGMTLGSVVAAWQIFSLLQSPMADICSLVSFYVAMRPNLALLREHAGEAEEASGYEPLTMGEKGLVACVDGTLWATPARGDDGKELWAGEFEVRSGELVVVKGTNGSGKSRLLDLVRGLSDPADLDGDAVLSGDVLRAAYLTYPVPVVPGTLEDNLLGSTKDPEAARVLDLGDLPERAITDQPLNLSLGERQKLGLLRALSRPEPVVLLDEPLANLDEATSARLCNYLAGQRGRRTIIAIMHSGDLDATADRVYEIRDGRLSRVK